MGRIVAVSILWVLFLAGAAGASSVDAMLKEMDKPPISKESILAEIRQLEEKQAVNLLDPDLHFVLASNYWRLDNQEKAIEHFGKVVQLDPSYYSAHWNLSLLHHKRGEGVDAIIHMRKAEAIFLEMEDVHSLARARKELRGYFIKYRHRPEDFELRKGFWQRILN